MAMKPESYESAKTISTIISLKNTIAYTKTMMTEMILHTEKYFVVPTYVAADTTNHRMESIIWWGKSEPEEISVQWDQDRNSSICMFITLARKFPISTADKREALPSMLRDESFDN